MLRSVFLAIGLCACAPVTPQDEPLRDIEAGASADARCELNNAERFVGREATQQLAQEVLDASGARTFQWVGPDVMVTMDFRQDRVRVSYDEDLMVTSVRCG